MRPHTRSRILCMLMAAGFILSLAPLAEATLSWTNLQSPGSGVGAQPTGTPPTNGNLVFWDSNHYFIISTKHLSAAEDVFGFRCVNGAACTTVTIATTDDVGDYVTAKPVPGTPGAAIGCYYDATSGNVRLIKTNDYGGLWSISTIESDTPDVGKYCDVAIVSATTYFVGYQNVSVGVRVSYTTNGGSTYSSKAVIARTPSPSLNGLAISASDSTHVQLVFDHATTDFVTCRSSDGAATWACQNLVALGAQTDPSIDFIPGTTTSFVLSAQKANVQSFCRTDDGGVSWACTTAGSETSGPVPRILAIDSNNIIMCMMKHPSGFSGNGIFFRSTNGGTSWTTEVAYTNAARHGGTANFAPYNFAGIGYETATGNVYCAFSWWELNGTDYYQEYQVVKANYGTGTDVTIAATATATFTGIVGFDVSPLATTIVLRTDSGQYVRALDAGSLTEAAASYDTQCNRVDGVFSEYQGNLVAFIKCDVTGDPTDLVIRTSAMTTPDPGDDFNGCIDGSFACQDTFTLSGFSTAGGDEAGKLSQIRAFPINYSSNKLGLFGEDQRQVAWGFASLGGSTAGKVGIDAFTNREGHPDERHTAEVQYTSAGSAKDMCIGLDGDQYYMVAVHESSQTKSYPLTFTQASRTDEALRPFFGSPAVFSTAYSNMAGVACGGSRIIIESTTKVVVINRNGGAELWSNTAAPSAVRGVAISERFLNNSILRQFAAYKDGSTIRVVDADTGTQTCTFDVPSGNWLGLYMDRTAQNVWAVTSTTVARYEVISCTTIIPVSPQQGGSGTTTPTTGPGLLGVDPGSVIPGVGAFGGNMFMGFLVVGMVATGSFVAFRALAAAGIGAALGIALAWGLGFFTGGVVFAIIVILALGFFLFYKFGG